MAASSQASSHCEQMSDLKSAPLDIALSQLHGAVSLSRSTSHVLRMWSQFVRLRDAQVCVLCRREPHLSAHHIVRRSFLPQAQFETGNGISLCASCHRMPHAEFNGRPDLGVPMDMQGGEKIELMMMLFGALSNDAASRGILRDDYYYVSDESLVVFKSFQGIPRATTFPGHRVEQAHLIWRQSPRASLKAVLLANGVRLSEDFIQIGSSATIDFDRLK